MPREPRGSDSTGSCYALTPKPCPRRLAALLVVIPGASKFSEGIRRAFGQVTEASLSIVTISNRADDGHCFGSYVKSRPVCWLYPAIEGCSCVYVSLP